MEHNKRNVETIDQTKIVFWAENTGTIGEKQNKSSRFILNIGIPHLTIPVHPIKTFSGGMSTGNGAQLDLTKSRNF
jgi:hypothetical protein